MNPKAIAPRFVTTHHRRPGLELKPPARFTHRTLRPRPVPARHRPHQRRATKPGGQCQFPLPLPQLERHIQRRLAYTWLWAGRCDHHSLLLASNTLRSLTATVRSHSLSVVAFWVRTRMLYSRPDVFSWAD